MNQAQRAQVAKLVSQLNDLKEQVESLSGEIQSIADDEQEKYDNMPEGFQNGEKGEAIQTAAEALTAAAEAAGDGNIQDAIDSLHQFIASLNAKEIQMIKLEHAWNTGARYSAEGQRIAACVVAYEGTANTRKIVFTDIDRGIWGEIPLAPGANVSDKYVLRDLTMANYNFGNYSTSMDHEVLKELGQLAAGKRLAHS